MDRLCQHGVLAAFAGPRLETPAEARIAQSLGADAVGMLLIQEAGRARGAEICLGLLGIAVNSAGGHAARIDRRGPDSREDTYFRGPHQQSSAILRETCARPPAERRFLCTRTVPQTAFGRLPTCYWRDG